MNFDFSSIMRMLPMFTNGGGVNQNNSGGGSPLSSIFSMLSGFNNGNNSQRNNNETADNQQNFKQQKAYASSFQAQNGIGDKIYDEQSNNEEKRQDAPINDSFMNMLPMFMNMMTNTKAQTASTQNKTDAKFKQFYDKDNRYCKKDYITSKFGFQRISFAGKKVVETLDNIKASTLST